MMFFSSNLLALTIVLGISGMAKADDQLDSCLQPGRLTSVCYQMKHLRSHIILLDAERDLMQPNFPLFSAIARSVDQLVTKLMTTNSFNTHMREINAVRQIGRQLKNDADTKSINTFRTANQLKDTCSSCHASPVDTASANHCNQSGRNPFVCKHMFGMDAAFSYFETAINANELDYELAQKTALELMRIADTIVSLGGNGHEGGLSSLRKVSSDAAELAELAKRRDPQTFQKSMEIRDACSTCHSQRSEFISNF